jgi:hypothetical protein
LINPELPVDDTSLVSCKSLNGMISLFLREKLGIHRVIRKKNEMKEMMDHNIEIEPVQYQ